MLHQASGSPKRVVSRRKFLHRLGWTACGASALTLGRPGVAGEPSPAAGSSRREPVPLIHQTDLFRPHCDPDDHFDLACAYALAARGDVNLLGILADFPPPGYKGDPDVAGVAMLNRLTGLAAPLVVGTSLRPHSPHDTLPSAPPEELAGVRWLLRTLRQSPTPAAISIVGSCRDVAVALRREPATFARKCRGIYLNAGTGEPRPSPDAQLEYNVALDPFSYATIFAAPCPVYWLPCFEHLDPGRLPPGPQRHGTFYQFRMGEVFSQLAPSMQQFFLSMLEQAPAADWLKSLRHPVDAAKLAHWSGQIRSMWSTSALLQIGGLTVAGDGAVVPLAGGRDAVYRFAPVQVKCDAAGRTRWQYGAAEPPRWKFELTDVGRYPAAMTRALAALLRPLGRAASPARRP
jgi:hypothetical protein